MLCRCIQLTEITKGILLPQLKQLFLHRNNIKQICNLEGYVNERSNTQEKDKLR